MQGDESSDTIGNLTALPSLTYTYHPQLTLDSLGSYVTGTTYDAAGRVTSRLLGSSGLKQAVAYTAWNTPNQGGRLDTIKAGTAPNYDNLQNLDYGYDKIGNILTILDAANSSQKQCFTYDALYRLTRGTTTNDTQNGCGTTQLGNGNYDLATTYDAATGNLSGKAGVSYGYNDANHDHAVTHLGGVQKYWYDANGNQVTRIVGSDTFNLTYDAENRLVEVKKNNITIATFVYDGDGNRVQGTVNGVTTVYVNSSYEVSGGVGTSYYFAEGQRIAMRKSGVVSYLLPDHLGSTMLTTNSSGVKTAEQWYKAWGESRYTYSTLPTKYTYTGQYSNVSDFGLMFYNARWYDPLLSRFTSADSIVPQPGSPQAWDRYSYVQNSPLNFSDPSGHRACDSFEDCEDYGITPMGGDWANLYFSNLNAPYANDPENMTISEQGIQFIKNQEGFSDTLYNDGLLSNDPLFHDVFGNGVGNCTIGWGHLIHMGPCNGGSGEVGYINGIETHEAERLLRNDILVAQDVVQAAIEVKLTQPQFDALTSLVFNWGENNFRSNFPTKMNLFNKGDYVGAALHFRLGPFGKDGIVHQGLVRRREAELRMILTMVDR